MATKNDGKMIFGKEYQVILHIRYVGQKFHPYRSNLQRFRDKYIFAFYADIQDGCQKWQENNFWKNLPDDSVCTLLGQ